jgi:cytochrome P450
VFDRPDELDLTRRPNPHLTFAPGTHGCLGAGLAIIQLQEVLIALRARTRQIQVIDEAHHSGTTLTMDRLAVRFEPGSRR